MIYFQLEDGTCDLGSYETIVLVTSWVTEQRNCFLELPRDICDKIMVVGVTVQVLEEPRELPG